MFKISKTILLSILLPFGFASPALAGTYARGLGETVTIATENATKNAEAAVRSRGKGCVGVGKDGKPENAVRVPGKDANGLWIVEVFYSFHAGSCGQMSDDKRLGIAITKAAIFGK